MIAWGFTVSLLSEWGVGIVQWLQCRTHDWKVVGLNPCWSSGRIFFSRVSFLRWLLYRYHTGIHSTPVLPQLHIKDPSHSAKIVSGRLRLNTHTLRMWLCMWRGAWLYGVHRTRQDGSSFMWHQPCQHCKHTTSVDIQKHTIKSCSLM